MNGLTDTGTVGGREGRLGGDMPGLLAGVVHPRPLGLVHAEWRALAHGIGEDVKDQSMEGTFLGVDEMFGMLLRDKDTTHLIPLTTILEDPA